MIWSFATVTLAILCGSVAAQYYPYSSYYSNPSYSYYPNTYNYDSSPSYSNYYWNNYQRPSRYRGESSLFGRFTGQSDRVGGNLGYNYGCLMGCKGWGGF